MIGTGLKKCRPAKRSGRFVLDASSVMQSDDVLEQDRVFGEDRVQHLQFRLPSMFSTMVSDDDVAALQVSSLSSR
jgi:hypothetical protein